MGLQTTTTTTAVAAIKCNVSRQPPTHLNTVCRCCCFTWLQRKLKTAAEGGSKCDSVRLQFPTKTRADHQQMIDGGQHLWQFHFKYRLHRLLLNARNRKWKQQGVTKLQGYALTVHQRRRRWGWGSEQGEVGEAAKDGAIHRYLKLVVTRPCNY